MCSHNVWYTPWCMRISRSGGGVGRAPPPKKYLNSKIIKNTSQTSSPLQKNWYSSPLLENISKPRMLVWQICAKLNMYIRLQHLLDRSWRAPGHRAHLLCISCIFCVDSRGFLELNEQWTLIRCTQTNETMSRQSIQKYPAHELNNKWMNKWMSQIRNIPHKLHATIKGKIIMHEIVHIHFLHVYSSRSKIRSIYN